MPDLISSHRSSSPHYDCERTVESLNLLQNKIHKERSQINGPLLLDDNDAKNIKTNESRYHGKH